MKKIIVILLVFVMICGSFSFAEDQNPRGMWSFYWDARELNVMLGSSRMSFDILFYNLYLFEDGSAFMTTGSLKNGKYDFKNGREISGVWLGDAAGMTIRVGDNTYKAWLDDRDRLCFKMTDKMIYIFNRVPLFNYKEGFLE